MNPFKIPIVLAALRRVQAGDIALDDMLVVPPKKYVMFHEEQLDPGGRPRPRHRRDGARSLRPFLDLIMKDGKIYKNTM